MAGRFSGGGGGGFMGRGGADGGGGADDKDGSPGRKGDSQSKSLTPVTIRMLMDARPIPNEDKFRLDNVELSHVSLVAVIRGINQQATFTSYDVEDGTGQYEAREFIAADESEYQREARSSRREDMYVRIIGSLRTYKDRRHLQVFNMRPVTDFNEITFHLLETIQVHLLLTRGLPTAGPAAGPAPMSSFTAGLLGMPAGQSATTTAGAGGGGATMIDPSGFTPLQSKIMQLLRTLGSGPDGVHIDELARSLAPEPTHRVREAVEYLANEGHAFSTTDDFHFKSTED